MMLNILLFSFLFDLYHKMVSPQIGDTRGGPPPPPPLSDATASARFSKLSSCPLSAALHFRPVARSSSNLGSFRRRGSYLHGILAGA